VKHKAQQKNGAVIMKKIDILTVLISSATLLLFCLCSYWLLSQYSNVREQINVRTADEISEIEHTMTQLINNEPITNTALTYQLEANKRVLKGHQNEWILLKQTLTSFVAILVVIVFSHLFFVFTLFRGVKRENG
jgi:multidrug transporter EmrE-like cation transporter